jgi:hypothetical protein
MKTYILTFAVLLSLGACQEEETVAPVKDPFIGSWFYSDSYVDVDLSVSFDASALNGEYQLRNINIKYSDKVPDTGVRYSFQIFDKFADNRGFGKIQLFGSWSTPTGDKGIIITFYYNNIYQKGGATQYVMSVDEVQIYYNGFEPIELQDQEVARI